MSERQTPNQQSNSASKEPTLPEAGKSVGETQNADQKPKRKFDWLVCWGWVKAGLYNVFAPIARLTDVGFVTAVLVGIAWLQWRVFDAQLEVFRGQLREMQSGSVLTQNLIDATTRYADAMTTLVQLSREKERPLVVVTRSDVSVGLVFKYGASMKINFVLNNDGHSATNAMVFAKLYVQQRSPADLAVEQRDICKEALSGKLIPLIPEGGTGSHEVGLTANAEEVRKGTRTTSVPTVGFFSPPNTRENFISPYLRGCVQYTYGSQYRRREFSGLIVKIDGTAIDPQGGDIAARDLQVALATIYSN